MPHVLTPDVTLLHRRVYSIATDGPALLTTPLTTFMGGLTVDLLSVPIEPGEYHLHLSATMGGIGLYVPRHAQVHVSGLAFWGGRRAETGPHVWSKLREMTRGRLDLSGALPHHALASFAERPITLHLHIDALMGGVTIYRP